jgi:hypothetical protein
MSGEPGDDSRAADQRDTARDALRSVLAGLAGMAAAGVWVWLLVEVLHPGFPALFAGIPLLYTTTPGLVVGLIDQRRPALTAAISTLLFYVTCGLVVGADFDASAWPVLVGGLVLAFVAALAALLGATVRRTRYGTTAILAIVALLFAQLFVLPELRQRRKADCFLEQGFGDVLRLVGHDFVRLPDTKLEWQHELVGGYEPGVESSTRWQTTTDTAGSGRCTLTIRAWQTFFEGDLGRRIRSVQFGFRPHQRGLLATTEAAMALLRELGLRPLLPELEGTGAIGWQGSATMEQKGEWRCRVTVQQNGEAYVRWYGT